LKRRYQGR